MFLNSISAGAGRINFPPVILLNPVGDGSEVGEVGICREFPRREPTVPTLSTAFSIKHPPDKTAHPPDEAAAVAAVVKDSLK